MSDRSDDGDDGREHPALRVVRELTRDLSPPLASIITRLDRVTSRASAGRALDEDDVASLRLAVAASRQIAALLTQARRGSELAEREPARRPAVLVIDDDALFLRTVARALSPWCDVITAREPEQARAATAVSDYDLVLCDLHLGAVSATDLVLELEAQRPGLLERVVFATGGDWERRLESRPELAARPRLEKPFRVGAVLELLGIEQ